MNLPEGFQKRMQEMLGEEYPAFLTSYDKPRRRGLRVNTLKIPQEHPEKGCTDAVPVIFPAVLPMPPEPVPWAENGFYVPEDVFPSRHPYYAAGLYYLQEPSAMALGSCR